MSTPEKQKPYAGGRRVSRIKLALWTIFIRLYGKHRGRAICLFVLEVLALYVLISGVFK
jgi:hypothetical protein